MRVTSNAKAFFEVVDVLIEAFSWGVSSQRSKGFALYETLFDPVRVTGREMRVLKRLSRFKMCADVKDSLVAKSSFPVLTRDWNKFLFFSGRLTSSTFARSKQICSFDDGDTQTRSIDLLLPCCLVTLLPCHFVTLLLCYLVTLLPCHLVTLLPC